MRQHALNKLRDLIEHLADIESIGEGIEEIIEDLQARGKIALLRRPAGSMFL